MGKNQDVVTAGADPPGQPQPMPLPVSGNGLQAVKRRQMGVAGKKRKPGIRENQLNGMARFGQGAD